jgi:hypothetical protein
MKERRRKVTGFLKYFRKPQWDRRIVELIPLGRPVVLHPTMRLGWRSLFDEAD